MQSYLAYRKFAEHPDVLKARLREQAPLAGKPSHAYQPSSGSQGSQTRVPSPLERVPSRDEEIHHPREDVEAQSNIDASREPIETPEIEKEDPYLVAWTPGDPENPHNWSNTRRWVTTCFVAQIALVVGFAASVDEAAAAQASERLGFPTEVISLETAVFLIGFGIASPFLAPLSELSGRNPVYIATMLLFVLFEGATALSKTIQARVILRFFAGMVGSTPLSNAGGSLVDMWNPLERTYVFPCFAGAGFLGPTIGPVIGAFIGQSKLGYAWCDWITAIWGLALLIGMVLFLPETFSPALLKMKASQMRQATGNEKYMSSIERRRADVPFKDDFKVAMARPFYIPILEPIVLFFALYMTMVYIVLFGDFEAYALVFEPYGFNSGQIGLTFVAIGVGILVIIGVTPITYRNYKKKWDTALESHEHEKATAEKAGTAAPVFQPPPPEERLHLAMWGTWLFPISLFWFAWTCYPTISPWPAIMSGVAFGAGILCCFISSYQYIIDAYESYAASALASLTLIRYIVSGGAVLWTAPMFKRLGNHWALSLLAFLSIAFSLIPWVFYTYGRRIRSWSRYSKHT